MYFSNFRFRSYECIFRSRHRVGQCNRSRVLFSSRFSRFSDSN
eukprot:UN16687